MDKDERRRKHAEYMRGWREAHPENKDYQSQYHKQRREDDPSFRESARLRAGQYYQEHRSEVLEKDRVRKAAKPKKGVLRGKAHPNWKGDSVGFFALHSWVRRTLGNERKCQQCGTTEARFYDWANKDHKYRRVLEDWMRLCRGCHYRYDVANGLRPKLTRNK